MEFNIANPCQIDDDQKLSADMAKRTRTCLPAKIRLYHILPRLPAKSVARLRCVSKQWRSFIKKPVFIKMHFHYVTTTGRHHPDHHRLLRLHHRTSEFSTIDINCEAPQGSCDRDPLPFKIGEDIRIVASSHGLVCAALYANKDRRYISDLVLWNPLTGDHRMISKLGTSQQEYYDNWKGAFGLYYEDEDYKLLRIISSHDAYLYSLKLDTWRQLEPTPTMDPKINFDWYRMPTSVVLNDKLYFLKHDRSVSIFDTKTEMLKEQGLPSCIDRLSFIMVLKGCIHIYNLGFGVKTDLWRLDGDEHWTKVGSSCYLPEKNWGGDVDTMIRSANRLVDSIASSSLCQSDRKMLASKVMCSYAYSSSNSVGIGSLVDFVTTFVSPNQIVVSFDQDHSRPLNEDELHILGLDGLD